MQLTPLVTQVQEQLAAAAALGDDRAKQVAAGLAAAAAPAVRLAVLEAVSAAADEITAALLDTPGSPTVTARLDGAGDTVVLDVAPTATDPTPPAADPRPDEGDATARISLRLSETLKTEIEQAAAKDQLSVNSWLVRAASTALRPDPLAALGALGRQFARGKATHGGDGRGGARVTGWIDG